MVMDFFAAQDKARNRTFWLLFWFAVAVVCITLLLYVTVEVFLYCFNVIFQRTGPLKEFVWTRQTFIIVSIVVLGTILWRTLSKIGTLSIGGGVFLAEELDGWPVERDATNLQEWRLINIVDEIAIASGMSPPKVYVLPTQGGINAFATGRSQQDAVIVVTQGALNHLSRDQLQGIIAHEFSHILNGDMRFNLYLIGVLNGILFLYLAGSKLLRLAADPRARPLGGAGMIGGAFSLIILMGGMIPWLIGSVGLICAKAIKAGVSRQREFLADAVAVQFTRDPEGLSGALQQIRRFGSAINHPYAEEVSHMFFDSDNGLGDLFATHPHIEERIRRIGLVDLDANPRVFFRPGVEGRLLNTTANFVDSIGNPGKADLDQSRILLTSIIPAEMTRLLHVEEGAIAAVLAPLLAREETARDNQLERIREHFGHTVASRSRWFAEWLRKQGPACRLPLIDLARSALRDLPENTRQTLAQTVDEVIEHSGKATLFQYVARYMLDSTLTPRKKGQAPAMRRTVALARLLAMLARVGSNNEEEARQTFQEAAAPLSFPLDWPDGIAISAKTLDSALATLAGTKPEFRKATIEACLRAIHFDQRITASEAELLRAVCHALECPVPPLAQYASAVTRQDAVTGVAS